MLIMRRILGSIVFCLASILSAIPFAWAQGAQGSGAGAEDFIAVEVRSPLSDRTRALLQRLVEPATTSQLIGTVSAQGITVGRICDTDAGGDTKCPNLDQALRQAKQIAGTRTVARQFSASTVDRVVTQTTGGAAGRPLIVSRQTYALFESDDPVVAATGRFPSASSPLAAAIAVPQNALDIMLGSAAAPVGASAAVATLDNDLRLGGKSERSFRINRLLPPSERNALVAALTQGGPDIIAVNREAAPRNSFSLIQFQSSGEGCSTVPPHWPFDVQEVKKTLDFNEKIRQRMKLGPVRRSRILIVDTGLGKTLAQTEVFSKLLYADPIEVMTPTVVQREFVGEPRCTDANDNGYWHDVYGAGSGDLASDDLRCLRPEIGALDIIAPHPRQPASTQIYKPSHGSFVGGLAAGGPNFGQSFPQVGDYIGLSFFRLPRKSQIAALDIVNEFADIRLSLNYAAALGADVINMSLKTAREEPFDVFNDNKTSLLVAAAGNGSEDLDHNAPENMPASLSLPDRMIVVAALQPNEADPLWPLSARSPSKVHIAAPGASITSFDASGAEICDSGTSAAAPLVSFTAAMIKALTGSPRRIIRARLLAAADHEPLLDGVVEEGRRLNVNAALDLFVDRIELDGNDRQLRRGWIEPDRTDPLFLVCADPEPPLDSFRGKIDLALLWEWRRGGGGKVHLRHQVRSSIFTPFEASKCDAPTGIFKFFDLETHVVGDIDWMHVRKILPTPFRAAKAAVLKMRE